MHLLRKAQTAHLKANKAFTKVFHRCDDFVDVFLPKLATKFSEYTKIKNYAIELIDD